jgi:hypothetical protein
MVCYPTDKEKTTAVKTRYATTITPNQHNHGRMPLTTGLGWKGV